MSPNYLFYLLFQRADSSLPLGWSRIGGVFLLLGAGVGAALLTAAGQVLATGMAKLKYGRK